MTKRWLPFFWFPVSPQVFGVVRASCFLALLAYYQLFNSVNPHGWLAMTSSQFWDPQSFFVAFSRETWLAVGPDRVYIVWVLAMVACAVGFAFRFSSWLAFLTFLYLTGLPINFGKIHHSNHMPVVLLGLLACVGSAGSWSIDAGVARWRNSKAPPNEIYGWFFRTFLIYVGLVYLNAGIQKCWIGGWGWLDNENMATILLTRPTITPLGRWVAGSSWLPAVLAGVTVVIETCGPLIIFSRTARWVLIPSLFFMHVGTHLMMGAHGAFTAYNLSFIALIPWLFPRWP